MNVNMYLNNLAALDIIIVVVYLLICIGIGYYHLKTIKTDKAINLSNNRLYRN
jgi:uncharacterized membrane protein YwzB